MDDRIVINTSISKKEEIVNSTLKKNNDEIKFEVEEKVNIIGGVKDYEMLENLPSINGTELKGNYNELDPTVPEWAKEDSKPKYTADDVGALDIRNEISFADIKELWDSIFND